MWYVSPFLLLLMLTCADIPVNEIIIVDSVLESLCAIWYRLYNLKIVENTHGGVGVFLVKLQAWPNRL